MFLLYLPVAIWLFQLGLFTEEDLSLLLPSAHSAVAIRR